ncbi:hypothetical protein SBV1_1860038 [Verrucomicrobia bacterium]|nr:hypothetical protein SBV1_1860038 [Verrucomicrobiota bacterium]
MPATAPAQNSTIVVTNLNDSGPGSLRQAIAAAAPGDTVSFGVTGTITLTSGELLVTNDLIILGPGAANLAISANTNSRVIEISSNASVTVLDLTICDGHARDGANGTSNAPAGGEGSGGGGICNAGDLALSQCVISNCTAGNGGGGYLPFAGESTNSAATNWLGGIGGNGGGINNSGTLQLIGCTLVGNLSGAGGAPGGAGEYGATGEAAGNGGGIYNAGSLTLMDCDFSQNVAGSGGAGYSQRAGYGPYEGDEAAGPGGNGGALCDAGTMPTIISDCQFGLNASGAGGAGSTTLDSFQVARGGGDGAPGGGGGAIWASNFLSLNGCWFLSNQTGAGGAGGIGSSSGGAGGVSGSGGAICAAGELSLTRCFFASNYTGWGGDGGESYAGLAGSGGNGGSGGAIYSQNALQLNDCTFSGNFVGPGGEAGSSPSPTLFPSGPGDGGMGGCGGALYCQSALAATNCTFNANQAGSAGSPGSAGGNPNVAVQPSSSGSEGGQGGAIFGTGVLALYACTLSQNVGGNGSSADANGTGIVVGKESSADPIGANPGPDIIWYARYGGAGGAGGTGGIYSEGSLHMSLCTLSGNRGGAGGSGGYSSGGFPGEPPLAGGAGGPGGPGAANCSVSNDLALVACTIAANSGGPGGSGGQGGFQGTEGAGGTGGISSLSPAGSASLLNTIVALNSSGAVGSGAPPAVTGSPDLSGSFTSRGFNLIGQTDGSSGFTSGANGDLAGSSSTPLNPLVGPLADNGGPTLTMALLHGSPALDAGDDALLGPPYNLTADQRGFPRKSGAHLDVGAFEAQIGPAPVLVSAYSAAAREFQFGWAASTPGATFSVLSATNLFLPLSEWTLLGPAKEIAPSQFQFSDPQTTNYPQRFFQVSCP